MNGPNKKQKLDWEDGDFSTREVRDHSHHKRCTRREKGNPPEKEMHLSVRWLKKAVEKFHEPGSKTFEDHCIDLKLSALKLHNEICGALGRFKPFEPMDGLSFVNVVLEKSKIIEETTLMRSEMESDELNSKMEITNKCKGKNCTRPCACASHEDKDATATRAEAEIRASRDGEKKLAAFKFKTKKTKSKRTLSAVQKFAEKKGDLVSDNVITTVARMCDIHQMDRLNWEKEKNHRQKISRILDDIRDQPVRIVDGIGSFL